MYTIYQIMPGDTMNSLSNKFRISMEEIRKINNLPFNYDFSIGEQIIVPSNSDEPFLNYVVKQGDNIYAIAQRYGVDVDILLQINGLNKDDYIYPNMKIIIPKQNIKTYIVKNNETLKNIGVKLNENIENIIKNNEDIYLLPGQLLIIKD